MTNKVVRLSDKRIKEIKASLKANGGNVNATSAKLGNTWSTVNKIRSKMKFPADRARESRARVNPDVFAAVKAALTADPNLSNGGLSITHGVARETVARARRELGLPALPRGNGPAGRGGAPKMDASDESRQRIADRNEIARLRGELKKIHERELDNAAMRQIIGNMRDYVPNPPLWLIDVPKRGKGGTPEVPVATLSDWHYGEVVPLSETGGVNEYDTEIARARVQRWVAAIKHLCRNHGPGSYPGLVLNLAGDFISGGLHPELLKTDALEQLPSAFEVYEILITVIKELADEFGYLYIPCVSGNHGRNTMKPEFKRYVYKNFDWFIYQLLAKYFAGNSKIVFDIPDSNEVHYRVWGKRFLLMHGDMMGVKGGDGIIGSLGPIARGEVKVSKQSSAVGKDIDMLIIAHFHQEMWLPRVTVNNALIGYNEFAKNAVRAVPSPPSQSLFYLHPTRGITSRWNVLVDEPKARGNEPWVSFEKR